MHVFLPGMQELHEAFSSLQPFMQAIGAPKPEPSDLHVNTLSPSHIFFPGMHSLHCLVSLLHPSGHGVSLAKAEPSALHFLSTFPSELQLEASGVHFISVHMPTSSLQSAADAQVMDGM